MSGKIYPHFKNNSEFIIIKEADKGDCVVFMNKLYFKELVF